MKWQCAHSSTICKVRCQQQHGSCAESLAAECDNKQWTYMHKAALLRTLSDSWPLPGNEPCARVTGIWQSLFSHKCSAAEHH